MAAAISAAAEIRKLRKKLRQIENLERLSRPLDDAEEIKVARKQEFRDNLLGFLRMQAEEEQNASEPTAFERDQAAASSPADDARDYSCDAESEGAEATEHSVEEEEGLSKGDGGDNTVRKKMSETGDQGDNSPKSEKMPNEGRPQMPEDKSPRPQARKEKGSKKTKGGKELEAEPDHVTKTRAKWRMSTVHLVDLVGHEELVTSASVQGNKLATGSHDTTVRVWDLEEEKQLCRFGGHNEPVTCVEVIAHVETISIMSSVYKIDEFDTVVISGSSDCTFRLWSVKSAKQICSTYTFSPLTCLAYCYPSHLLVIGTEGGKLELWSPVLKEKAKFFSVMAYEDAVTNIKTIDNTVYSSSKDGRVMVHKVQEGNLIRVFASENLKVGEGPATIIPRPIRSLEVTREGIIVYGDDSFNLKMLDWKKGTVRKLPNHDGEFTFADALCVNDSLLFSSSHDIDKGIGYVNVRLFPSGEYVASLVEDYTERIMCLACTQLTSGNLLLITGGVTLTLWEVVFPGGSSPQTVSADGESKVEIAPDYITRLAKPAVDSEAESEDDVTDSDEDDDVSDEDDDEGGEGKSRSWCSVM